MSRFSIIALYFVASVLVLEKAAAVPISNRGTFNIFGVWYQRNSERIHETLLLGLHMLIGERNICLPSTQGYFISVLCYSFMVPYFRPVGDSSRDSRGFVGESCRGNADSLNRTRLRRADTGN